MKVFSHSVSVNVQDYLNGGILLQDRRDPFQGMVIGPAPVQFSVYEIINRGIVDDAVSLRLTEALADIFRQLDAPEELYARYSLTR